MPSNESAPGTMSIDQAAALFMISRRWLFVLMREGVIPKSSGGRLPVAETVRGYVAFLADRTRRTSPAETAVATARAEEIRARVARDGEGLIEADEAEAIVREIANVYAVEAAKLATPFRRRPEVAAAIKREVAALNERVEKRINERIVALREPRRSRRRG